MAPDKIDVKQGDTVKIVLKNTGAQMHELVIGTKKELDEHAALMARPSRNSTIRPSAFSRRRRMFHPISKRDSGRKTGITFADRAPK